MKEIRRVNIIYLVTVLFSLALSGVLAFFPALLENMAANLVFGQVIYITPMLIYVLCSRQNLKEIFRIKKISLPNVGLLILFTYCIQPLLTFLNLLSRLFAKNEISVTVTEITDTVPFGVGLIIIALIPSILEECVYRGVFFHEYSKVNPLQAMVLSGLLFGALHMNFNQFIYAFVMGVILALVVEVCDSIVASMIIHFVINGTSVTLVYITQWMAKMAGETANISAEMEEAQLLPEQLRTALLIYGVFAIIGTSLAAVILNQIGKRAGRGYVLKSIFEKREEHFKIFDFLPMIVGIIICVGIMFGVEFLI